MTPEQAQEFMSLLLDTLRNERAGDTEAVLKPVLARMEVIAQHQAALARLLQQNRRDFNATEVMKAIVSDHMVNIPGAPNESDIKVLGDRANVIVGAAYQIAIAMEAQGVAADEAANPHPGAMSRPARLGGDNPGEAAGRIFKNKAKAERKERAAPGAKKWSPSN